MYNPNNSIKSTRVDTDFGNFEAIGNLVQDQPLFVIKVWQGSGYVIERFIVNATSEEEALEKTFNFIKGNTHYKNLDQTELAWKEELDEGDESSFFTLDGGFYVWAENLAVVEVSWDKWQSIQPSGKSSNLKELSSSKNLKSGENIKEVYKQIEQFFRAPVGVVDSVVFDGSDEDMSRFNVSLQKYASWNNDNRELSDEWYNRFKNRIKSSLTKPSLFMKGSRVVKKSALESIKKFVVSENINQAKFEKGNKVKFRDTLSKKFGDAIGKITELIDKAKGLFQVTWDDGTTSTEVDYDLVMASKFFKLNSNDEIETIFDNNQDNILEGGTNEDINNFNEGEDITGIMALDINNVDALLISPSQFIGEEGSNGDCFVNISIMTGDSEDPSVLVADTSISAYIPLSTLDEWGVDSGEVKLIDNIEEIRDVLETVKDTDDYSVSTSNIVINKILYPKNSNNAYKIFNSKFGLIALKCKKIGSSKNIKPKDTNSSNSLKSSSFKTDKEAIKIAEKVLNAFFNRDDFRWCGSFEEEDEWHTSFVVKNAFDLNDLPRFNELWKKEGGIRVYKGYTDTEIIFVCNMPNDFVLSNKSFTSNDMTFFKKMDSNYYLSADGFKVKSSHLTKLGYPKYIVMASDFKKSFAEKTTLKLGDFEKVLSEKLDKSIVSRLVKCIKLQSEKIKSLQSNRNNIFQGKVEQTNQLLAEIERLKKDNFKLNQSLVKTQSFIGSKKSLKLGLSEYKDDSNKKSDDESIF